MGNMKLLFIHPNMPGQYKHLARYYGAQPGNEVIFLTKPKPHVNIEGVRKIEYKLKRTPRKETHHYLHKTEEAVLESQQIFRILRVLKDQEKFVPDIIIGHVGWGGCLFVKDIYPDVPVLGYMEFFYHAEGYNIGFLPDETVDDDKRAATRMQNTIHLQNLHLFDWFVSPTNFQKSVHPAIYHDKITVLHDGIDTEKMVPRRLNSLTLPNGVKLLPDDKVITYISRNFEPYRGFPQFMRAAELLLKRHKDMHIILVGQDGVSYGSKPKDAKTWREVMMQEVDLPEDRFHYLGRLPHDDMLKVMQISTAHIYLTVPFVLSWSMMEAMSAGCCLIASDTEPVREVATHNENALLVDFFDHHAVADAVDEVLAHKTQMQHLRDNARQTILDNYALNDLLPQHLQLVDDVHTGKLS